MIVSISTPIGPVSGLSSRARAVLETSCQRSRLDSFGETPQVTAVSGCASGSQENRYTLIVIDVFATHKPSLTYREGLQQER